MNRLLILFSLCLFACQVGSKEIEEAKINYDIVLVDFWAEGCKPCVMIEPIIEEIKIENSNIKVISVDINSEDGLNSRYEITHVPTVIIYYKGSEFFRFVGFHEKEEYMLKLNELKEYDGATIYLSTDIRNCLVE